MPIPVVPPPTVAICGSADRFPVRRIWCVGQNYADHAREMGGDPTRQRPFFFAKPSDAVNPGGALPFPVATGRLDHEVELVVALGGGGRDVAAADALGLVWGYGVGLDLTRRDLQAAAKQAGRPWAMAKGFDRSAPIGPLHEGLPPATGAIALAIDGETRQAGDLADMIWSVPEVIAILSTLVELAPGDLIFTGTPAGVGPIRRGERVVGTIAGCEPVELTFS